MLDAAEHSMAQHEVVVYLRVSPTPPVACANALSGAASNEGDTGTVVFACSLELHWPQLTNAAQHDRQNEAFQPTSLCQAHIVEFNNICYMCMLKC